MNEYLTILVYFSNGTVNKDLISRVGGVDLHLKSHEDHSAQEANPDNINLVTSGNIVQ